MTSNETKKKKNLLRRFFEFFFSNPYNQPRRLEPQRPVSDEEPSQEKDDSEETSREDSEFDGVMSEGDSLFPPENFDDDED